jgi:UPF0755 protein
VSAAGALRKLALAAVLLAIVAGVAVAAAFQWYREPIAALTEPVTLDVTPGESLAAVAQELAGKGVMPRPRLWTLFGRYEGKATKLRAGEYLLEPGLSPAGVLDLLVSGRVVLHSITIVEGWTFAQALAAVRAAPTVRRTLDDATPEQIMTKLGSRGVHPEGQLFPDTYLVARGTSDLDVLELAHRRLQQELADAWTQRLDGLPLDEPYEALILASIVEKETGAPDERPRIAGVFVNRLRLGMRLQTDPTVIYGLGTRYDGDIRSRDLRTDTPYNTYTRAGLPPTPIALVGREALRAATRPLATDELFFVATGLGDGRHVFSKTYAEHDRAVDRMLARQRGGGAKAGTGGGDGGGNGSGGGSGPAKAQSR